MSGGDGCNNNVNVFNVTNWVHLKMVDMVNFLLYSPQ